MKRRFIEIRNKNIGMDAQVQTYDKSIAFRLNKMIENGYEINNVIELESKTVLVDVSYPEDDTDLKVFI